MTMMMPPPSERRNYAVVLTGAVAACLACCVLLLASCVPAIQATAPTVQAHQIVDLCATAVQPAGFQHRIQLLHPAPAPPPKGNHGHGPPHRLMPVILAAGPGGITLSARNCTVVCTDISGILEGADSHVDFALACLAQYPSNFLVDLGASLLESTNGKCSIVEVLPSVPTICNLFNVTAVVDCKLGF